ncbi:MAG: L,D-transpeptidase [Verrucomicrobiota bacterium]
MSEDRSTRPVRLNATPRLKSPKPRAPRGPRAPKGPRKPSRGGGPDSTTVLYWIGALAIVVLLVIAGVWIQTPGFKAWFTGNGLPPGETPPENLEPLPQRPDNVPPPAPVPNAAPPVAAKAAPPQPTAEELRMQKLREEAAKETQKLVVRNVPLPLPGAPTNQTAPAVPPLVQPAPAVAAHGVPARALPVDTNVLTTERIAAYQVALERVHFSCGFIDGDQGMRTQRMLRAYQASHGLPVTGFLDPATREAIGEPGEPFLTYTVKEEDVASIMPKPQSWRAKAKASRLGYNEIWEMLAEKFHCTRAYLKSLNRGITTPVAGTQIIGPKVYPASPLPHAASLRINLGETSLEALDADGHVIAFFPCSIAKDKNKRPHGELTVKVVDDHPDYTFDPALFADSAKAEGITHKLVLPPGPRNPVGTTWVGLSLPGYGIHGTPDPEAISRTQSHGCFRLANWNAEKVLKMVRVGTPVDVEP